MVLDWPGIDTDLDLYLYPAGVDLYGEGFVAFAFCNGPGPEFMSELVNITGDYYLAVDFSTMENSPYLI